ncbi:MAG: efflux RND transporter permease subunit [Bacteroidales bacterium]|nr:efflux RND transporter permease subunit [Bacteroidales bacterium]
MQNKVSGHTSTTHPSRIGRRSKLTEATAYPFSQNNRMHPLVRSSITAAKILPANYGYEFGGISREESKTGNNVVIIFFICLVLVYLILSALYESFFVPFAVILSIPFGLLGSFLFAQIFGLENNIYLQTGMVMLIGLLAKTAILITELVATVANGYYTLCSTASSPLTSGRSRRGSNPSGCSTP